MDSLQKRLINSNGKSVNLVYRVQGLSRIDDLTLFRFIDGNDGVHTETVHQRHFFPQSGEVIVELSPTEVPDDILSSVIAVYLSMGFELGPSDSPFSNDRRRMVS